MIKFVLPSALFFIISFYIGIVFGAHETYLEAIKHNAAGYNYKTGEFEWADNPAPVNILSMMPEPKRKPKP